MNPKFKNYTPFSDSKLPKYLKIRDANFKEIKQQDLEKAERHINKLLEEAE